MEPFLQANVMQFIETFWHANLLQSMEPFWHTDVLQPLSHSSKQMFCCLLSHSHKLMYYSLWSNSGTLMYCIVCAFSCWSCYNQIWLIDVLYVSEAMHKLPMITPQPLHLHFKCKIGSNQVNVVNENRTHAHVICEQGKVTSVVRVNFPAEQLTKSIQLAEVKYFRRTYN